jgi:hypothetical protein
MSALAMHVDLASGHLVAVSSKCTERERDLRCSFH